MWEMGACRILYGFAGGQPRRVNLGVILSGEENGSSNMIWVQWRVGEEGIDELEKFGFSSLLL